MTLIDRIEKLEKEMKVLVEFQNNTKLFYDKNNNLIHKKAYTSKYSW